MRGAYCTKISPGCKKCYAETMAGCLKAIGVHGYENGFRLTLMPERLSEPLERRKPTVYFVNSMSDPFHEKVPFEYIRRVCNRGRRVGTKGQTDAARMGGGHIKRQCVAAHVAFFFKQWGTWGADGEKRSKTANGRKFRGRTWDAMPPLAQGGEGL
jgi:protein gp37